jgi:periplasmic protein TonB
VKRWILPALCALGIHAALFTFDPDWSRPAFSVNESRAVTISLVEVQSEPEARHRVAPAEPPRTRPAEPQAAVRPRPLPAKPDPAQLPTPEPPPAEPETQAADVAVPAEEAPVPDEAAQEAPHPEEAALRKQDFGPEQADVQASVPLYALNPAPVYPPLARRRNYEGTVILDVLVDTRGRATEVRIAHSSGHASLDQSALASVRRWRFEPARRSGTPIDMWVQVPVRFALE